MNERFKELAQEARLLTGWPVGEVEYQKFGELLVQKCANICNKIYFERYPDAEDWERSEEGDAIKQYFGVK